MCRTLCLSRCDRYVYLTSIPNHTHTYGWSRLLLILLQCGLASSCCSESRQRMIFSRSLLKSETDIYSSLDLQFYLNLGWFWLFMLTYIKNVHSCLYRRVFLLCSRENVLIILASKCTKCKLAKSGATLLSWRRTTYTLKPSQTSIYLCFFEDTGRDSFGMC